MQLHIGRDTPDRPPESGPVATVPRDVTANTEASASANRSRRV